MLLVMDSMMIYLVFNVYFFYYIKYYGVVLVFWNINYNIKINLKKSVFWSDKFGYFCCKLLIFYKIL